MITSLRLKNFKKIGEQAFEFTNFDLLVGRNNSGKSTVLQALAIWQFCVDEFARTDKKRGTAGIQVVLPNFTALPLPEFNLLWKERVVRRNPQDKLTGEKTQSYSLIEIEVSWVTDGNIKRVFQVDIRYQSPQTIYALPSGGWDKFNECKEHLPRIAYVPPFSGLEPAEKWLDPGPLRQQVGKGQPGSVLRNLLLKVVSSTPNHREDVTSAKDVRHGEADENWKELAEQVKHWFGVDLTKPKYDHQKDVHISVEYKKDGRAYDLISAGSGFHQTMTLLAFLYGYRPTTILLDEPDAHLHVNLQREILDFFKTKSNSKNIQFLIATHAEEFVRGVDTRQIVSLLAGQPIRVPATTPLLNAMSRLTNEDIVKASSANCLLYVEGEDDERLLRAWAKSCGAEEVMLEITFFHMRGGNKKQMMEFADDHFNAIKLINKNTSRLVLLDWDSEESFHPQQDNPAIVEWGRKNIENYLLVESAWNKALRQTLHLEEGDLFAAEGQVIVREFFANENLTQPAGKTWREANANIFKIVDGKKILYGNDDSLFQRLKNSSPTVELPRLTVAKNMNADEIHQDVHDFFIRLKSQCRDNNYSDHKTKE
jgi:AAA15 family ATPase/GTPase